MSEIVTRADEPKEVPEALARRCPFCGAKPTIQFWHGGKPTKRLVACSNDMCVVQPSVTGQTPTAAIRAWNTRHD